MIGLFIMAVFLMMVGAPALAASRHNPRYDARHGDDNA